MPRFTIFPSDNRDQPAEFVAEDAGQVLNIVHRHGWASGDIHKDGAYLYSVAMDGNGVWSIFTRTDKLTLSDASAVSARDALTSGFFVSR